MSNKQFSVYTNILTPNNPTSYDLDYIASIIKTSKWLKEKKKNYI